MNPWGIVAVGDDKDRMVTAMASSCDEGRCCVDVDDDGRNNTAIPVHCCSRDAVDVVVVDPIPRHVAKPLLEPPKNAVVTL